MLRLQEGCGEQSTMTHATGCLYMGCQSHANGPVTALRLGKRGWTHPALLHLLAEPWSVGIFAAHRDHSRPPLPPTVPVKTETVKSDPENVSCDRSAKQRSPARSRSRGRSSSSSRSGDKRNDKKAAVDDKDSEEESYQECLVDISKMQSMSRLIGLNRATANRIEKIGSMPSQK